MSEIESVLKRLVASQAEMAGLLLSVSAESNHRPAPGEWSFSEVAAHMCQVEIECWWSRIQRILNEEQPDFGGYYLNTGWDFSSVALIDSVSDWYKWRQRVGQLVRTLDANQLSRTGTHGHFGKINVIDLLNIAADHDNEHLADLRPIVATMSTTHK